VNSGLGRVYYKEAAVEQSKMLSQILSVRTEKHQENVSQVTRSLVGLKVGSPKYKAGVLSTGPRYPMNRLYRIQIYLFRTKGYQVLLSSLYVNGKGNTVLALN